MVQLTKSLRRGKKAIPILLLSTDLRFTVYCKMNHLIKDAAIAICIGLSVGAVDAGVQFLFRLGLDTGTTVGFCILIGHYMITLPGLVPFLLLDAFDVIPSGDNDDAARAFVLAACNIASITTFGFIFGRIVRAFTQKTHVSDVAM